MTKLVRLALLAWAAMGWQAVAQTWDSSGNGMLQGTYYFREVIYLVSDSYGDLGRAIALYGNLTFSGSGTYTMAVSAADSNYSTVQSGSFTGTYSIAASGQGFITMPSSLYGAYNVYGLVSQQGIFVGSATEAGLNDLFIAAPLASPLPTNASFKGSYTIAAFDLSSGSPTYATSYEYQLNPDGAGNLGNVSMNGYFGGGGTQLYTQSNTGLKYSFSNGGCNLAFPNSTSAPFISGQRFLYISPDGSFVFGGSPYSWDMFVGVRTGTGTVAPNLSGLYYQAGFDEDGGYLDSYYGALNAGGGNILEHQRTLSPLYSSVPYGGTYSSTFTVKSDGTYSDSATRYLVGPGNTIRIGSGIGPALGLNVALAAPSVSGTGVYLAPNGVVNAASWAPFTAGIAPGELITLSGTNLAAALQVASSPFPTMLGGVQVSISGLPAPIYYVYPTAVSVIVPYAVTGSIAQIQVNNGGTLSNTVTAFVNKTAPGVFTQSQNGLGYGAVTHSDYTLVTAANPVKMGETISVYLTGLGTVNPLVADGAPGPSGPYSTATNTIAADVNGVAATVGYAGLAPFYSGLYQLNITLPATGLTAGDNYLDILGPDSYTSEALIPVVAATSAAAAARPAVVPRGIRKPRAAGFVPLMTLQAGPGLHSTGEPIPPFPAPAIIPASQ